MSNTTSWTGGKILRASRMWKYGMSSSDIALAIGVDETAVQSLSSRRRDLFPFRSPSYHPVKADPDWFPEEVYPERVTRITISGATVTLPRVTFIDGPAPMAAE